MQEVGKFPFLIFFQLHASRSRFCETVSDKKLTAISYCLSELSDLYAK